MKHEYAPRPSCGLRLHCLGIIVPITVKPHYRFSKTLLPYELYLPSAKTLIRYGMSGLRQQAFDDDSGHGFPCANEF